MKSRFVVIAAWAVLLSVNADAHHSFAGTYVEDKRVSIEGTLVSFDIRNPHSFVTVEVKDKDGKAVRWGCEWGSVAQLTESGVNRYTLKTGDKVIVQGAPGRDPEDHRLLLRGLLRPAANGQPEYKVNFTATQ